MRETTRATIERLDRALAPLHPPPVRHRLRVVRWPREGSTGRRLRRSGRLGLAPCPPSGPVGVVTRGTTNPNRLRRCDRWLVGPQAWRLRRHPTPPVVVDLGYGASPVTAVELHDRLRRVRDDVEVVGIEIDPERVAGGQAAGAARAAVRPRRLRGAGPRRAAARGRPGVQRAAAVRRGRGRGRLGASSARLAPGGMLVDGTCDELGRLATWVAVDRRRTRSASPSRGGCGGWSAPGSSPSGCRRRSSTATCRASRSTRSSTALDDAVGALGRACAAYGVRQRFIGHGRGDARRGMAGARRARHAGGSGELGASAWRRAVAPHQGP